MRKTKENKNNGVELTKTQEIAVKATGKQILVSAGAGTGKTHVLVERFLQFVTSGEALVTEILALTFTEKAANEMKKRIQKRLRELGLESASRDLESAYISTFHAFASRLLKEHPLEAGVDPDFRVLESEEADFFKEQALDEVLEEHCEQGNTVFELLRTYQESKIRTGLIHVLDAARHEGKYLSEFFADSSKSSDSKGVRPDWGLTPLFERVGEKDLARDWERIEKQTKWDWKAIQDLKVWRKSFAKKRGSKGDTTWAEIKTLCDQFLAQKMDILMQPWREKFEPLALLFEEAYEAKKKERGFLDFEDLQIKAVRLFKSDETPHPLKKKLQAKYRDKFRQILVDEFQDTNYLQLELIEALAKKDNLFLVGDYKQSIYGFRGAEPQLFLKKEREFESCKDSVRIPLLENFRTQEPVLSFINQFFKDLWSEDELPFEELIARAKEKEAPEQELLLVEPKEGEELAVSRMREADRIAERILKLQEEGIALGEMAILFSAMKDTGIYEQALKRKGIPYFVLTGRGFYHQPEIRDIMSYLAFLDNPRSDIPLAAALRSPLFQIHDNSLFWLSRLAKSQDKYGQPSTPLYEGVRNFETIEEISEEQKQNLRFFDEMTREMLALKDRLKLTELLDHILAKTSYELTVLADPQGVRRYANLKKLVNLTREFEKVEPMPLGVFLRTVRRLELQEARESEAQIEAEASGHVVRLLTIHRAKGLEFEAVFVADLARSRQSSEASAVLAEAGRGYALQVRNDETLEMEKPASWNAIHEQKNLKDKEEWKRLFYVALTRAKTKLILSGVHRAKRKEKDTFRDMSSWIDWVMKLLPEDLKVSEGGESLPQKRKLALAEKKDLRTFFGDFAPKPVESFLKNKEVRKQIEAEGQALLKQTQKRKKQPARVIDLPVSAFALYEKDPQAYQQVYEIGYPDTSGERLEEEIKDEEEVSHADFGTAVHAVLERIDFKDPFLDFEEHLTNGLRMMPAHRVEEARGILQQFFETPFFKKLAQAKRIRRELPFVLNERHGAIYGVIDLLYQDSQGHWHVVDYKTAVGDPQKVKASAYDFQIAIYAHAVSQILGTPPKSGALYFLKNQWEYQIALNSQEIEKWANRLKSIQDNMLELRSSSAETLSSAPTDGILSSKG